MRGNSLNFIPSLEDISMFNKEFVPVHNEMELIVSKK